MRIENDVKLDYRDVLIRPKRSILRSRAEVDPTRHIKFPHSSSTWTGFPVIAANMDTVGTMAMTRALSQFHALVALHKYYEPPALIGFFGEDAAAAGAFYTLGLSDEDLDKYKAVASRVALPMLNLDVANGYTEVFVDFVKQIRTSNPTAIIMAGTVATAEMTEALVLAGADIVRVGIGSGSVCTTRTVTGVGYPQLSAVIECADAARGLRARICADGGCSTSGDIAKALGAGADFVMLGGMLAGHEECEGEIKYEERDGKRTAVAMSFYGMASDTAMTKHAGGIADYRAPEGRAIEIPFRGSVASTMRDIMGGVRSAMTYIGAKSLREIPRRTTFIRVNSR